MFELLGGQVGKLQRDRRQTDITIGVGLAPFGKFFVMNFYDLACEFPVRRIKPETIDAQHLNVNSPLVERLQTLRPHDVRPAGSIPRSRSQIRILYNIPNFRHDAVSMHIDDLDTLAAPKHFPALDVSRLRRLKSGLRESAAGNQNARSRA